MALKVRYIVIGIMDTGEATVLHRVHPEWTDIATLLSVSLLRVEMVS